MKLKIGTRGSKLALWQAYYVADKLKANGVETEIVVIETKGDKVLDVSISKIGSKGVFTEELEAQLTDGGIDMAVHSAKDMQSRLQDGFEIIAFTEREVVNDVIVSHREIDFENTDSPIMIGTSSTRRVALFKHFYPHVKTVDIRGNLQTRIAKMEGGLCDGLALAYAGVHRMGYSEMIKYKIPLDKFIPAVGQGSVAVEVAENLAAEKKEAIRKAVNHSQTEYRLLAERAYLRKLEGGCSIPVFGMAELTDDILCMNAGIVSLDGSELLRESAQMHRSEAEILGLTLAEKVLAVGGDRILENIKKQMSS